MARLLSIVLALIVTTIAYAEGGEQTCEPCGGAVDDDRAWDCHRFCRGGHQECSIDAQACRVACGGWLWCIMACNGQEQICHQHVEDLNDACCARMDPPPLPPMWEHPIAAMLTMWE